MSLVLEHIMREVLIVDDHPAIRMAVKMVLEQNGYSVVGETDNGVDALRMNRELAPQLIILDIAIPNLDGLAVIERVKAQGANVKIVVLTAQPAAIFLPRCIRAGAAGFVCKTGGMHELVGALVAVKAGYTCFPVLPFESVLGNGTNTGACSSLTDREIEVLRQLASGTSNKEIAEAMSLSNKTISSYKFRIMDKLKVNNLVDLVEVAKRDSII